MIESLAARKLNLSMQSHSLAKAIFDLNEGYLNEAQLRFESLFENTQWSKDHLRAGDLFLWQLMARRESARGQRLVKRMQEIRSALGFSNEDSLLGLYENYFLYLNNEISSLELQKKTLRLIDGYKLNGIEKGARIGQFLLRIVDDDPMLRISAFEMIGSIPLLQRFGMAMLSLQPLRPSLLRSLKAMLTDDIAKVLLDLHLSRLTEDLLLFVECMGTLARLKAVSWAELLDGNQSSLSLAMGKTILNSELVIDGEGRRVLAVETMETLDSQPLLTELTLSLFRSPMGLTKELAALGTGYSHYDPLQHDPIIYNLVSRLRDWMRKQGLRSTVTLGRSGWSLSHREMIFGYFSDLAQDPSQGWTPSAKPKGVALNPRLDWILTVLEKRGSIERIHLLSRFSVQKSTAANDFNRLIELGLIERHGRGRGIFYTLKEKNL
jgi:hypothetical protein